MWQNLPIVLMLIIPSIGAILVTQRNAKRSARDVCDDLRDQTIDSKQLDIDGDKERKNISTTPKSRTPKFGDELSKAGLLDAKRRRQFNAGQQLILCGVILLSLLIGIALGKREVGELLPFFVLSFPLGYLIQRSRLKRLIAARKEEQEFFLPLVMERLVMGAEAGLDILPALQAIVKVEEQAAERSGREVDAITSLIRVVGKLTDSGLRFEDALSMASSSTDSSSIKHAFIHLSLAQKEGGELIMPLRELSDATQLYFQETVEESIAKMPAKATMPLLCTFAGLVICFLTPAMLQVISVLEKSVPR